MPTVYITNRSGHDFSPAKKFGDIRFLSEGAINPYAVAKVYRKFAEQLRDSAPEDYILISGLSLMSSIAIGIMARKYGRINLLQYHSQTRSYKSRTIIVDELIGEVSLPKDCIRGL